MKTPPKNILTNQSNKYSEVVCLFPGIVLQKSGTLPNYTCNRFNSLKIPNSTCCSYSTTYHDLVFTRVGLGGVLVAHCPQFSFHGVIPRRETIQLKRQQKARLEGTVVCHFPAMTANLVTMRRNASEKIICNERSVHFLFHFGGRWKEWWIYHIFWNY